MGRLVTQKNGEKTRVIKPGDLILTGTGHGVETRL